MKTLARILAVAMVASFLMAGSVMADTIINPDPTRTSDDVPYYSQNVSLEGFGGILDRLYGWENVVRVSDDSDSFFTSTTLGIRTVAKYANYGHQIGYSIDGGANINVLYDLANNDYLADRLTSNFESTSSAFTSLNLTGDSKVTLFLDPYNSGSGAVSTINAPMWSSDSSLNSDSSDHMVTYKIIGNAGFANNNVGNYVVAWEDNWADNSVRTSDWDFNDVVLEIQTTPEPATMILLGLGLLGLGIFKRKADVIFYNK